MIKGLEKTIKLKNDIDQSSKEPVKIKSKPLKLAVLGSGCGILNKSLGYCLDRYGISSSLIGVEINQNIVNLAKKYFSLHSNTNNQYLIQDAYEYVNENCKEDLDGIVVDIDNNQTFPPQQFMQAQFFSKVSQLLEKSTLGFFAINTNYSGADLEETRKALNQVFKTVELMDCEGYPNKIFIAHN